MCAESSKEHSDSLNCHNITRSLYDDLCSWKLLKGVFPSTIMEACTSLLRFNLSTLDYEMRIHWHHLHVGTMMWPASTRLLAPTSISNTKIIIILLLNNVLLVPAKNERICTRHSINTQAPSLIRQHINAMPKMGHDWRSFCHMQVEGEVGFVRGSEEHTCMRGFVDAIAALQVVVDSLTKAAIETLPPIRIRGRQEHI